MALERFWWEPSLDLLRDHAMAHSGWNTEHWQAKIHRFLRICLSDCFIYRSNFVFRKFLETTRYLGSGRKTVNSQGYSKIREPIKTRENCNSLIW